MHLVRRFLSANKAGVGFLAANGFCQAACNVALAIIVRDVFDAAAARSEPPPDLWAWATALLGVVLLRAFLVYDETSRAERLGQAFAHQLRFTVFEHLGKTYQPALHTRSKGALTLRLSNDVTPLRQWVTLGIARLLVAGTAVVGTLLAMALIDWRLSIVAVLAIAGGAAFSALASSGFGRAVGTARRDRGRMANDMAERLAASATIAVFGQSRREARRIRRHSETVMNSMLARAKYAGTMRSIAEAAVGVATGGALLVGAWLVEFGSMSVGSLAAAVGVIGLLSTPVRNLERVFEYYLAARVAHAKAEALLALPRVGVDALGAKPKSTTISIRQARFAPNAERLTARIGHGKKVALSGPFAAALLTAVAGLSEPEAGRVRIGRVTATTIEPRRRSRLVTLLSADVPLLRGSVRRNVAYAHPRAGDDDVLLALERAGIAGDVQDLPEGLDSRVTEGGTNLSPALRLRIALARALMGEPPIVLIDQMSLGGDTAFKEVLKSLLQNYSGTILIATDDPELTRATNITLLTASTGALPSAEIIPFRAS